MSAKVPCCYSDLNGRPGCAAEAKWVIVFGRHPNDCTEACTKHVGYLLTDEAEHRVYPLDNPLARGGKR